MKKYPDRYIISGIVKDDKHKGQKVCIYWTPEGGGWWQWGPEEMAERFESQDDPRFKDALRCATGQTWTKATCGPWYYSADLETVKVEAVPAIVKVVVK